MKLIFIVMNAILFLSFHHSATNINGIFKYCTINENSPVLKITDMCHIYNNKMTDSDKNNIDVSLLEKRNNQIDGDGFQCLKTKIVITTSKSFFGVTRKDRKEISEQITEKDCQIMSIYRLCNGKEMTCNGKDCLLKEEPIEKYSYFSEETTHAYHCFLHNIIIIGKNIHEPIFSNNPNCKATDLFCQVFPSSLLRIFIFKNLDIFSLMSKFSTTSLI